MTPDRIAEILGVPINSMAHDGRGHRHWLYRDNLADLAGEMGRLRRLRARENPNEALATFAREVIQVEFWALATFAREVIQVEFWDGHGMDGGTIQELAQRLGLIVAVPGGYDPEIHERDGAEIGDPWFEFAPWLKEKESERG